MAQNLDKIIVVDIEATCWESSPPPGQESEIIEIGVCLLDTARSTRSCKESILVRPERSTVSDFCTRLTTLTQAQVETGISFAEACAYLRREFGARERTWASYGDYDRVSLRAPVRRQRKFTTLQPHPPQRQKSARSRSEPAARNRAGPPWRCSACPWKEPITGVMTMPGTLPRFSLYYYKRMRAAHPVRDQLRLELKTLMPPERMLDKSHTPTRRRGCRISRTACRAVLVALRQFVL